MSSARIVLVLALPFLAQAVQVSVRQYGEDEEQSVASGSTYRQELSNHEDMSYSAAVSVGGQTVQGVLDTGSFDFLVFSMKCVMCAAPWQVMKYYNPWTSPTRETGSLSAKHSFGSGDTFSNSGTEKVSMGPLVVGHQAFWEVVKANLPILANGDFQAIIGVGPPGIGEKDMHSAVLRQDSGRQAVEKVGPLPSNVEELDQEREGSSDKDSQSAIDSLRDQQTLLENLHVKRFSTCLGRKLGSDGYFIWNDKASVINAELFTAVPIIGEYTWSVSLKSLQFEGGIDRKSKVFGCQDGCAAIVDSGTSLISVPSAVAKKALEHLNTLKSDCKRINEMPTLTFEMGGNTFNLPPHSYIGQAVNSLPSALKKMMPWMAEGGGKCELLLLTMDTPTPHGPLMIMGMPFFREYYTTFELGDNVREKGGRFLQVAPASQNCQPGRSRALSKETSAAEEVVELRTVDLSKVRVGSFMQMAHTQTFQTV